METRSTTSKKAIMEKKRQSRKSKINAADTAKRSLHHLAKEDHNDDNASFSTILLQYPEILSLIVGFMPFNTARKFLGSTSKFIRDHLQHKCEKSITSVELTSAKAFKRTLCINRRRNVTGIGRQVELRKSLTKNLISLDVGRNGSDKMLKWLRTSKCTSTLKVLKMVGSGRSKEKYIERLTDIGLWYIGGPSCQTPMMLGTERRRLEPVGTPSDLYITLRTAKRYPQIPPDHHQSPFQALEEIDITFCSNTTYRGTFFLRDGLPNLKYLRRLPDWLCGNIHAPSRWSARGYEVDREVYTKWMDGTYWMDGTCSFAMDVDFEVFVNSTIQDCAQGQDRRLALVDLKSDQNEVPMIPGRRHLTVPGLNSCTATILHLTEKEDPESSDGRTLNYILVGQNMSSTTTPLDVSWLEQVKNVVAVGESKTMYWEYIKNTENGGLSVQNGGGPLVETKPDCLYAFAQISKVKISPPLPPHAMMPPRHIVERHRPFWLHRESG